jgi:hypothetical protein
MDRIQRLLIVSARLGIIFLVFCHQDFLFSNR